MTTTDYTTGQKITTPTEYAVEMIWHDDLTTIDIRTVPHTILLALRSEAGQAGDSSTVTLIDRLVA